MPDFESFSEEYHNMENKILDFKFGPVSVGSESKMKQKSSMTDGVQEWCNCEKCEKISTT